MRERTRRALLLGELTRAVEVMEDVLNYVLTTPQPDRMRLELALTVAQKALALKEAP